MVWTLLSVEFEEPACLLASFQSGAHTIEFVAEYRIEGDVLFLDRLHVHGAEPNVLGASLLRKLGRFVKEQLDVAELRVGGAVRTTGASPGRKPRTLVF